VYIVSCKLTGRPLKLENRAAEERHGRPTCTADPDLPGGSRPGTPRWVKVFVIIAAVVILVFLILLLAGNDHGPGRHPGPGRGMTHAPPGAPTP
jgi:hypothetical protein